MNFSKILFSLSAIAISMICVAQDDELMIEMHGQPDATKVLPSISIWDKTTPQLIRALKGKTREEVLYIIDVVSTQDRIIKGPQHKYTLVEYKQKDTDAFRKLLFQEQEPQIFLTAAGSPEDVLAINKKYGIILPLSQVLFEKAYAGKYHLETDSALPANARLYELSYRDVNTPKPQAHWFLFENKQLSRAFYTEKEKQDYLKSIAPTQTEPNTPVPTPTPRKMGRKALVSGGTTWDKMYMPQVVHPKPMGTRPTTANL